MFGTVEEPGLIPKCLHRIFRNVVQNMDNRVLFKPVGLENFTPTIDSDLNAEVAVRNYVFKDEKVGGIVFLPTTHFDLHLFVQRRMRLPEIIQQQDHFDDLSVEGKRRFILCYLFSSRGLDENYSIWISFFELYNENILDLLVQPKEMKRRKNLRLVQNDHSTVIKNLIQIPVFDIDEAEEIIKFGFANRATSKTNLNEASSRSHALICITLITINEFDEEPTMTHMCKHFP